LVANVERRETEDAARQSFAADRELGCWIATRAAASPAMTTRAGWAAVINVVIADVTTSLLGPSVFGQLRALGVSYIFVEGSTLKIVSHQSVASGGFIGEAAPIIRQLRKRGRGVARWPGAAHDVSVMRKTTTVASRVLRMGREVAISAASLFPLPCPSCPRSTFEVLLEGRCQERLRKLGEAGSACFNDPFRGSPGGEQSDDWR